MNCLVFQDFNAKNSSFKIPKKKPGSPDGKDKKSNSWIESSFDEEEQNRSCLTRSHNQRQRSNENYAGKRKSADIGYRIMRQGLCIPRRRWKHADPPGTPSGWKTKHTSLGTESSFSHGMLPRKLIFYRAWSQSFCVLFPILIPCTCVICKCYLMSCERSRLAHNKKQTSALTMYLHKQNFNCSLNVSLK